MSKNHSLIVSSAGSGKTTLLVRRAIMLPKEESVLITTYTQNNEKVIREKFITYLGFVPKNITIQTWFSFLLQHCIKPFQGSLNDELFEKDINGLILVSRKSGFRYQGRYGPVYWGEDNFSRFYFTSEKRKIYSDKLSKFVFKLNQVDDNNTLLRLGKLFDHIMIDEVQDLAGHDLELIKLFMQYCSNVTMVGDPRQVTYLTHLEAKNSQYNYGKIENFLKEKCSRLIGDGINHELLKKSHRCSDEICYYASLLYPDLPKMESCECCNRALPSNSGLFIVKKEHILNYLESFKPIQLRWNKTVTVSEDFEVMNFGESKGDTFDRVLIYPTEAMGKWLVDSNQELSNEARAKFYVGITRAKYSVAFVFDYDDNTEYENLTKWAPTQ